MDKTTKHLDYLKEPICPLCGGWVLETECFDTDYDNDTFIRKCLGQCQGCHKELIYHEYFEYQGVRMKREA